MNARAVGAAGLFNELPPPVTSVNGNRSEIATRGSASLASPGSSWKRPLSGTFAWLTDSQPIPSDSRTRKKD